MPGQTFRFMNYSSESFVEKARRNTDSPNASISASNVQLYLGQSAGSELYSRLKRARRSVKIVSPYIKAHFIDVLSDLQPNGVKVTILTTEDVIKREGKKVAFKLVRQIKLTNEKAASRRKKGKLYSLLSVAAFVLLGIVGVSTQSVLAYAFAGVLLAAASFYYFHNLPIYAYSYQANFSRFKVFVSPYFRQNKMKSQSMMVHLKAYVIDDEVAYLGSLNLTQEGFFDNYESCFRIDDRAAVAKVSSLIDDLYHEQNFAVLDIHSWGKSLYREPKN